MFDIYYVSLDSASDRRNDLERKFPKNFRNFKFVKACDGRKLYSREYYCKVLSYYKNYNKLMSPGELGCTLSHIEVLTKFLQSDSKYALIFEDDIIGSDRDIKAIEGIIPYLDECSIVICGGQDGLLSRYFQFGKPLKYCPDLYLVHPHSYQYIYRTCSYLVTRKAASLILEYQTKHTVVADHWAKIFKNTNIKFYYTNIFHHPTELASSSIESERLVSTNEKFFSKFKSIKKIFKSFYTIIILIILFIIGYRKLK